MTEQWRYIQVILILSQVKQENQRFECSLGYSETLSQENNKIERQLQKLKKLNTKFNTKK
jgi:hypothetical protein